MSDDLIKQALAELGDIVHCRCHEAYKDRNLQDPQCQCDSADALTTVSKHIEQLERELDEARHLQSCACNYDTPTDVCMGHHALFERLYAAERGKLEAKLAKAMRTIKRTAEQLDWCQAARDIRKELDVVLAELEVKE